MYEVGAAQCRLETRLHAGTLLTPEYEDDGHEMMALARKGPLIDAGALIIVLGNRLD